MKAKDVLSIKDTDIAHPVNHSTYIMTEFESSWQHTQKTDKSL